MSQDLQHPPPDGAAHADSAIETLTRRNAELELRLDAKTQALQQAQRELQSLTYSISHDLRAPLRTINGFCRIVCATSAGKLDAQTAGSLERIAAAATRMGRLIDGLLKLSQLAHRELHRQPANLSQIAGEVAGTLTTSAPERRVRFSIAANLSADADSALLALVLENLIGNAWKFTAHTDNANIEVGRSERDAETFFVRDNGAGFEMRYAGKLFGAFQRLHSEREFEGIGIGLCITQRIISMHHGRIWAEAKHGEGATFYFTLARAMRAG